nr:class I mannose-6-phosphate isomerase [Candidatus Sigynarchaeota archaeon]
MQPWILHLPANRTRRGYRGGLMLDRFEGAAQPVDNDRPEDWVASLVPARNPGLPPIENEGLARVPGPDGQFVLLKSLVERDPVHFLGADNVQKHGTSPTFLVKLLDSAIRLHVQAHPTRALAQQYLNAPFGKLECYHILDARPGIKPYIRLGFQHPPSPSEFKRVVMAQDIAAMDAWFEPVPVKPGETWLVQGGLPHAIGEGVLMVEIMEPSDLSVRFEFERAGIVVPPEARFLGRDIDFAMNILDFSKLTVSSARNKCNLKPRIIKKDKTCIEEILVDDDRVDCFRVKKITAISRTTVPKGQHLLVGIVIQGSGTMNVHGEAVQVAKGSKVLVPAAAASMDLTPGGNGPMVVLACTPGSF